MHTAGGYLDHKTRSPMSMGAAIVINGTIIGALLLSVPEIGKKVPRVFKLIPITAEKPPEPITAPEEPRETQRAARKTVAPIPIFETPVPGNNTIETEFTTDFRLPSSSGTGDGFAVTPPPAPVFIGPRIDPRYAKALQPAYPPGKQRLGEEGVVVVRVLVGPDGRVLRIEPVEAADGAFFKATAEHAMKRWRFTPATRDGIAVEGWRTMTVRFELKS